MTVPTPEEWRKLKAEWTHDYGLRRMEDRGVKYEDQAERRLDRDAARGNGEEQEGPPARSITQGQAAETPPGPTAKPAEQPPHPWTSEIAKANRHQPGKDHGNGYENGHDRGHSM